MNRLLEYIKYIEDIRTSDMDVMSPGILTIQSKSTMTKNTRKKRNAWITAIAVTMLATSGTGKILGLMPHPERGMFFNQMPNWPLIKEESLRSKKKLPNEGPGMQLFKNAVQYFS